MNCGLNNFIPHHVYRCIQHPHILSLLGVVEESSKVMIITNLVLGPNLHDLVFSSRYGKVRHFSLLATYASNNLCAFRGGVGFYTP